MRETRTCLLFIGIAVAACSDATDTGVDAGDEINGSPTDEPYPPGAPDVVWFKEVSHDSGIDVEHRVLFDGDPVARLLGGGVAVGDLNGDSIDDVVLALGTTGPRIFRGLGDLRFVDVTAVSGLASTPASTVGLADLDRDGVLDLLLGRDDLLERSDETETVRLYRGAGDASFRDDTIVSGLMSRSDVKSLGIHDIDGDGLLDIYVATFGYSNNDDPNGMADELYRNRGDGTFEEVSARMGLDRPGLTWVVAAFDVDGDTDTDLYIGRDSFTEDDRARAFWQFNPDWGTDLLFQNIGPGSDGYTRFQKTDVGPYVSESRATMNIIAADFDADGASDLYLSDFGRNDLLLRRADKYEDATVELGLEATARDDSQCPADSSSGILCLLVAWGGVFEDFDLDGQSDLLIVHGHMLGPDGRQPVATWQGMPDGSFRPVHPGLPWMDARSVATSDLDSDGDLDLIVVTWNGPVRIFENLARGAQDEERGYLEVRFVGTTSPIDGRGTQLSLQAGARTHKLEVGPGGMPYSTMPPVVHFGLGPAQTATVVATWPSGLVQTITDVARDQVITLTEPSLLQLSSRIAPADGTTIVEVVLEPRGADGGLRGPGRSVTVDCTLGKWVGPVADLGDGRYRRQLIAPDTAGLAVIRISVDGSELPLLARVEFTDAPQ